MAESKEGETAGDGWFHIVPQTQCPHLADHLAPLMTVDRDGKPVTFMGGVCAAEGCGEAVRKSLCLACHEVNCARDANGHAVAHGEASGHAISMALDDLSIWCYGCDAYLDCFLIKELHPFLRRLHLEKHGTEPELPAGARSGLPIEMAAPGGDDGEEKAGSGEPEEAASAAAAAGGGGGGGGEGGDGGDGAAAATAGAAGADATTGEAATAPTTGFAHPTFASAAERAAFVDRVKGLVYGNCVGDAVGLATEFMDKREAAAKYGDKVRTGTYEYKDVKRDMHRSRWAPGDWTDDSDQMVLALRSFLEHDGDAVPADFGRRLVHWMHRGFPELGDTGGMGIGYTVMSVLNHRHFKGGDPHRASMAVWEGSGRGLAANGAVMRTSIMAVPHFDDLARVEADTIAMAKVTHSDPRCIASCVAVTTALALMLQGKHATTNAAGEPDFDTAALTAAGLAAGEKHIVEGVDAPAKTLYSYHADAARTQLRSHLTFERVEQLALDEDRMIGYTLKCAGSGFWALRQDKPFRQAMGELVAEAGDADTNGAVAGAMLGCRLGFKRLHAQAGSWIDNIPTPQRRFIDDHIDKLLVAMIGAAE